MAGGNPAQDSRPGVEQNCRGCGDDLERVNYGGHAPAWVQTVSKGDDPG